MDGLPADPAALSGTAAVVIALRSVFFWLGLLVVLPQALLVRRRAERFEDATGPTEGVVPGPRGGAPELHVVGIGDSIIAGVGARTHADGCVVAAAAALAAAREATVRWTVLGGTGATASGVLRNLVPLLPEARADVFLVSCGVNDLTDLRGTARFRRDLTALIDALREHSPGAPVMLFGVPTLSRFPRLPEPMRSVLGLRGRTFDLVMGQVARSRAGVLHMVIDPAEFTPTSFAADGYHPSEDSYARMGREAGEWLARELG